MDQDTDIMEPPVDEGQQPGPGPKTPPQSPALSEPDRARLDGIVQKMIQNKESDQNIRAVVNDFKTKYAKVPSGNPPPSPAPAPAATPPEHQISHTTVQDVRHLQDMASKPVESTTTTTDPLSGGSITTIDPASAAANKAYNDQYDKAVADLGTSWGTKPESVKQVLKDFPNYADEGKLKGFAQMAENNPAMYARFVGSNTIVNAMSKDGPQGIHDANIFTHLQDAGNYDNLTQNVIPTQQDLMSRHGLGPEYMEALKSDKAPLINSLDPGLLSKYWNSDDKELGLTPDQYAGLETERLFSPQKAQMDLDMIKHSRNLDESGKANPIDVSKEPYEYRRGLENVLMNLDYQGRNNKAAYISENKPQVDAQVAELVKAYNDKLANANPTEAAQLHQQFNNEPLVQEANKLQEGQDEIAYSASEDAMRYPLNTSDKATRIVKDAMQGGTVGMADVRGVLQGAGETADNTMRWIKNTAINLVGSEGAKAFNNTVNIGHQSLTDLSGYEGSGYAGVEQPLNVPRETIEAVQNIFKDPTLTDDQKQQKAISYVRDNMDQLTINPKAGQQNMTGKSIIYNASNTIGQILGIANQSFLMGGVIGDASKLQQMASAFTPMYMSTQNQMYEQALKNGDEHPLLKSNVDATIISLASLINPDVKVVRGMVGAESQLGKTLAGISDETWGKVLSENKPLLDQAIGFTKATGKQLGLANLQYGLIAPVATGLAHKVLFNEDPNLADRVKDGVIQASISMALPALLHGVWGGKAATEVNPTQKYALVEAGLHPDENIDLIDSRIKSGQLSEVAGHDMKMLVKHAGEFMLNTEMTKTDGTPMDEKEVADNLYANLRLKVLQGKLKTAAEPMKPVIEEKIHEVNKEIADLHTSEDDRQKAELNQLLHDNLDRIRDKIPTMEQPIKDAIAENRPEDVYKMIAEQAQDVTKVDGKEVSTRAQTEEIFGKPLVEKAIELSKQKSKDNGEKTDDNAQTEGQVTSPKEGTENLRLGAVPSIISPENQDNATSNVRSNTGQGSEGGNAAQASQDIGGQNLQFPSVEESGPPQVNQQAGQPNLSEASGENVDELPFGRLPVGVAHNLQVDRARAELGMTDPERGSGVTLKESIDTGKELLKNGADVGKIVADFQKDKKISYEDMSVVRAAYNELADKTNKAADQYGPDSPQAKAAATEERSFYNNAVKPMQTEWSKVGVAQQGAIDLDTGSVMALRRAFEDKSGKSLTTGQEAQAKEMAGKVKELNDKIEKLQKQLDEAHQNKGSDKPGIKQTGKALADKIRKAKIHRPDSFSAATPASLVWDSAVELTAKSVEAGATIADAIAKGIEHIKNSDWYKGLKPEQQSKVEKDFSDFNNDQANEKVDLAAHFVDKKDSNFTPEESKAIWEHAKNVIASGKTDFHDVVNQVGMDTGLTNEQVRRAIAQPKGAKVITDQMYADMYRRRQVIQQAQAWVKNADQSWLKKAWTKLVKIPSAIVTFGHGSVAPITHVGGDLYRPSNWKSYFGFMLDSYKYSFGGLTDAGKARYEKAMGDLTHDPMYTMAKRAGLKIDPTDLSGDDYSKYQGVFGKISKMGERGFNAMKPYRLEQFKKIYNGLTDQAKANSDVLKEVAHIVNLSSGTTDAKIPPGADAVFFAPKLVASQYQRILSEPAKAVATFTNWGSATDADKLQAKMVARHAGEMIATYMSLLAANQGLLTLAGSNQKINFTNPLESDWMKFKMGGKTVDASGGMNSSLRFVGSLLEEGARANGIVKTPEKSKPGDSEGRKILQQMTNKLSPAAGDMAELFSGTDAIGNTLPWSSVKPAKGKEKLSVSEYAETKLPIPIAEGIKTFNESAKDQGLPQSMLDAILVGGLTGTTGAKIAPDYTLDKQSKGSQR